MTITELVLNFQGALQGLKLHVERVGIAWDRSDAYDEWDSLATATYQALVVEPLRSSCPQIEREQFSLATYDMLLPSYAGLSVIEILPDKSQELIRVFHALGTLKTPFDMVEWRVVSLAGVPQSDVLEVSPLREARFALRLPDRGKRAHRIEEIVLTGMQDSSASPHN